MEPARADPCRHPVTPPLGSLQGRGLYQSQLIYSLNGSDISADVSAFGTYSGLIPDGVAPAAGAPAKTPQAWELGLWTGPYDRNDVLAQWGHKLNVVVTDGVQYGDFVPAVVAQNAAP
jgi:hypothetical protein